MKKTITLLLLFTTCVLFSQVPSYVPTNGLVGWWPFTGNANDLSGNGNNGNVVAAALTTDRFGNLNNAYDFDGVSQFIEIPSNAGLSVSNFYSISVWISSDIWSFNAPIDEHAIVSKINNGNWNGGYEIYSGGNGFILHTGNIGSNFLISSEGYLINTWYFITVTFDGTNVRLFINGILVDSTNRFGSLETSNVPLRFGRRGGAGNNNNWFNGKIDDIGIWNRALTQQEITNLYNASLSTEDFVINDIYIYPNPTTSILYFKSSIQIDKILIYNMLGQLVQDEKVNAMEGAITIEKLAQGTYLVKVNDINKGYTIIKN